VSALAGARLAVKDVLDLAGTVTGAGNPDFARDRPPAAASAGAVQQLVDAGCTVVAKTMTDELAYSLAGTNVHYGMPPNPAAPGRVPGGSSSGSASAVASGTCDLGLGTDTGGSIRVPASYCGILGWRPTWGAVDTSGVVHLARSFDTVGLLARDAALLVAAASVLVEDDGSTVTSSAPLEGLDLDRCAGAFRALQGREAWLEHGTWITATSPRFGPGVAERFRLASLVTDEEVAAAELVRDEVRAFVAEATAGGRVLRSAAAAGPAPTPEGAAGVRAANLRLTCVAGLAGAPVVVRPGPPVDGLPVGEAAMGAPGSDLALLRWALR
jgi:amidase